MPYGYVTIPLYYEHIGKKETVPEAAHFLHIPIVEADLWQEVPVEVRTASLEIMKAHLAQQQGSMWTERAAGLNSFTASLS